MEPLPFGVFSDANPAIKVGAIILMDGVAIDAAEPTVGVSQPLQPRVLRPELCISTVTWQKVPTRTLCSLTPTCASRRTGGDIQMGRGDGRCRCHGWRWPVALPRGAQPEQKSERASRHRCHWRSHPSNSGRRSCRRRLRSFVVLLTAHEGEDVGARWATPSTSPPAVLMHKASQTAFAGGAASAAGGGLTCGVVLISPT